ncbi:hypothetical protein [Flavobacterium sp.]|uniref:hypothetical protein n=1 Tax=Flavobacterium sp. TaxID=239 RepID=UPI001B69C6F0|nr:hypothetical protein [Flavobacterium sp.]MBP6126660.1 hypothetical protein [Flavobacterium sp.]
METNNFKGKFNYTYKETGYNEQDFKKVYDAKTRSIDCELLLPNHEGKYVIEMEFETPDGKHKDFVSSDLKNIVLNGSDLLYLGIHLKGCNINENKVILNGDFILEIKYEMDGFHIFNFNLEIENTDIISVIEKEELISKL